MTLITNYFDNEKIIIASDKRRVRSIEGSDEPEISNKSIKLYKYGNYVIGVFGRTRKGFRNYLLSINTFMLDNKDLIPSDLLKKLQIELFPLIEKMKQESAQLEDFILNLTISGAYSGNLFSYYYQFKDNKLVNCMEEDKYNIRFNDENSVGGKYFSKSFEFINEKLFELKLIKTQTENKYNLLGYKKDDIIEVLKWMYRRFDASDSYHNIGGPIDYYIVHKTGEIESQ